jgi:hypothetical protein
MAKTNAFKVAELIRVFSYDTSNDVITTSKELDTKHRTSTAATYTSTTEVALDTFAHADFRAARYVIAMSEGANYHSTEIVLVHDGSTVTMTQYGTLKNNSVASFDADISGSDLRLLITPASANSTTVKFHRTLVGS